jgi:hypothetical protein
LNEWFLYWTKKLQNEQSKKPVRKGRKRRKDYDDNSDEDFIDDSSKDTISHLFFLFNLIT